MRITSVIAVAVTTVCIILTAASAIAADPVGRIEKIRGEAERLHARGTEPLTVGSVVYTEDVIRTGDAARLRIRFLDTSSLQLSENTEFLIDDLVYQGPESAANQSLVFLEGVFGFISGSIAQADREAVSLTTPVATIGIRGTQVVFGVLTVGMPPGEPHYGFQIWDGAVEITSPVGSVTLDEPGEGTFLPLTRTAAPTPVRRWTEEEAAEARDLLAF
ncbi:MAG: FecR domain-containing protein [Rhodospirillales bacterium]